MGDALTCVRAPKPRRLAVKQHPTTRDPTARTEVTDSPRRSGANEPSADARGPATDHYPAFPQPPASARLPVGRSGVSRRASTNVG